MKKIALGSPPGRQRKGSILVLSCLLMIVMMAVVAMSVDLGYIYNVRTELDRAVDAGALAGAATLVDGTSQAQQVVSDYVQWNSPSGEALTNNDVQVEIGTWDEDSKSFTLGGDTPSALRVTAVKSDHQPLFFARVLGHNSFPMRSSSIAMYQPRDMMLVLDTPAR